MSQGGTTPASGVRYALVRVGAADDHVAYEGFAHLPDVDVPLAVRVALPGGAVSVIASPAEGVSETRRAELAKAASALMRAATKAEVAAGRPLPRKIVRWRG
jgi:hypothetical protein